MDRSKLRWNGYGWTTHTDELANRDEVWTWLAAQLGMPALLATPARDLNDIQLPAVKFSEAELQAITQIVGAERLRSDASERAFHTYARNYPGLVKSRAGEVGNAPDAIVYPRSGEEVTALFTLASEREIAVRCWGGGSHGIDSPKLRAIALDLSGLERVNEIQGDIATFDAGISGPALEKALQAKGRTLGHRVEAFEFSTLGGWIAQGDAGTGTLRYGAPRDWLTAVTVATPQGLLVSSDAGLRNVIVGSRGLLGAITQASVRTKALSRVRQTRTFLFPDFPSGQSAVRQMLEDELPFSSLILSDGEDTRFWHALNALGKRRGLGARLADTFRSKRGFDGRSVCLSLTLEGMSQNLDAAIAHAEKIAAKAGATALDSDELTRKMPLGYFRDSLLDHGVGLETFNFETDWAHLSALHASVAGALEKAFAENAPCPGAKGIPLAHAVALPCGKVQLALTYIFPRQLGNELPQWENLQKAAQLAAGSKTDNSLEKEVLTALKKTVDPKGILGVD